MKLSFNKLWKLLIDLDLSKSELSNKTGISRSTFAKMARGENINTSIIIRICETLNSGIEDIVEVVHEKEV